MSQAAQDIAAIVAWVENSSPAKFKGPMGHDWTMRGPWATMWPCDPDNAASYPDLSELGEQSLPLFCASVALSGAVLAGRVAWDCASLGAVSDRLRHLLVHRCGWDLPGGVLAVGIASPATTINAALAAEGLSVDLTETALLAVPLYTVTASDRARTLEVCRSTYAVAA